MAFSNSPLVTYENISPNKNSPRNKSIDRITIHCVVGQWTAKQGCDYFANSTREASCNYFVGKDGSIGLCVEEKDRSWCSSSSANDHRAITIETASETVKPYVVTDEAYNGLLDLCTDICKRNGKTKLLWFADKDTTLNYTPESNEMVMTVHRWFANKSCPGDYLYDLHDEIAAEVTRRLSSDTTTTDHSRTIWDYFMVKINNEFGVAGLMGNLHAESLLHPDIVQGDIPYSSFSKEYTSNVDSGVISEYDFVHNGPNGGGYGLAQWTYSTRKQALYDMWKSGGYSSIGSIELALDYLWYELENDFTGVLSVLKTATSIREASDKVLHDFESPADQSETVELKRADNSQYFYNRYATGSDSEGSMGNNYGDGSILSTSKLSSFLLLSVALDN